MKFTYNILLFITLLLFVGCSDTTLPPHTTTPPPGFSAADMLPHDQYPDGIYHTVHTGDTLWRISRKYNVQLSDILRYNQGLDTRDIKEGTRIFIPHPPTTITDIIDDPQPPIDSGFIWPVQGTVIQEHTKTKPGLLIQAPPQTPVKATRSGKVLLSISHFPGRWIIIDHGDFWGIYGNLGTRLVDKSAQVQQGQIIGTTGNRPLHIEFRRKAGPFNPRDLLGR